MRDTAGTTKVLEISEKSNLVAAPTGDRELQPHIGGPMVGCQLYEGREIDTKPFPCGTSVAQPVVRNHITTTSLLAST